MVRANKITDANKPIDRNIYNPLIDDYMSQSDGAAQTIASSITFNGSATFTGGTSGSLLIQKTTATAAVTTLSLTGLNLIPSKLYMITNKIKNVFAGAIVCKLFYNNDTTDTNYYEAFYNYASGIGFASGAGNDASLQCPPAQNILEQFVAWLTFDLDGHPCLRITNHAVLAGATGVVVEDFALLYKIPLASITRIDYVSSVANSFGVGSELAIYALD
jgi:hypothetical protein